MVIYHGLYSDFFKSVILTNFVMFISVSCFFHIYVINHRLESRQRDSGFANAASGDWSFSGLAHPVSYSHMPSFSLFSVMGISSVRTTELLLWPMNQFLKKGVWNRTRFLLVISNGKEKEIEDEETDDEWDGNQFDDYLRAFMDLCVWNR